MINVTTRNTDRKMIIYIPFPQDMSADRKAQNDRFWFFNSFQYQKRGIRLFAHARARAAYVVEQETGEG